MRKRRGRKATANDVDADDENNNENNSVTTHPVMVATLLVLWIVPMDVPDSSQSHLAFFTTIPANAFGLP